MGRRKGMRGTYDFGPLTIVFLSDYFADGSHRIARADAILRQDRKRKDMRGWSPACGTVRTYRRGSVRIPAIGFARAYRLRRFGLLHVLRVQDRAFRFLFGRPARNRPSVARRILAAIGAAILAATLLTACGGSTARTDAGTDAGRLTLNCRAVVRGTELYAEDCDAYRQGR